MIKKIILFLGIASTMFFAGCYSKNITKTTKPNVSLTNTYFKALNLNGHKVEVIEKEAHIKFAEKGTLNGNLGCNAFFGSFKVNDKNISFENIGSTKMMCSNIKTEDEFIKVLQNTKTYEIKGEILSFFDEKGDEISSFKAIFF